MMVNLTELIESGKRNGLIAVAHPDDETIGAAGLMSRLQRCQLIHVTDGAPRESRFWTHAPGASQAESRTEYARIRRTELARALGLVGVESRCASGLGVVDMEAVLVLGAIAERLANAVASLRPDFVITHGYTGGHPDHDAVAFAAWAARRLLDRRGVECPPMFEMALYHGAGGDFHVGELLRQGPGVTEAPEETELTLSEQERALKRSMLDCFESQRETLAPFYELDKERFRPVPDYDFTKPPHEGQLLYERNGFPMSGERWRSFALRAVRALDVAGEGKPAEPVPASAAEPGREEPGPEGPGAAETVPASEVERPGPAGATEEPGAQGREQSEAQGARRHEAGPEAHS